LKTAPVSNGSGALFTKRLFGLFSCPESRDQEHQAKPYARHREVRLVPIASFAASRRSDQPGLRLAFANSPSRCFRSVQAQLATDNRQ
jgi:hypothetical protein